MKEPGQEKEKPVEQNEWVTNTALGPAECRAYTDIPFSREIYEELRRLSAEGGVIITEQLDTVTMPKEYLPLFEARYKLINRLVRESNSNQILEIASGYSPRGIEMAQDASVNYVELDRPVVANRKRALVDSLIFRQKIPVESNLHILGGDALSSLDLEAAAKFFGDGPLTIINEGLLKYLTIEEKATLGRNIHRLLSRFGGVWITPDFSPDVPSIKKSDREIEMHKGFDFKKRAFGSMEEFIAFFEQLGFTVEQRNFGEIANELVSPKVIGFSEKETKDIIKKSTAFVMRVVGQKNE